MAAVLIPAMDSLQSHRLRLPFPGGAATALEELHYALGSIAVRGAVILEADDWLLRLPELRSLREQLETIGLRLVALRSRCRETLVAASALGLEVEWPPEPELVPPKAATATETAVPAKAQALTIHQGTLRSGDHLQVEGSVLLLGEVNPGARISACGDVLVWGRLRGVAHAGRRGDRGARIVAMQLRPLQLRIADVVARGPQDFPPDGLAEEARLVGGEIRIDPAPPVWPMDLTTRKGEAPDQ
jgi:septum site-determining protein MinC